MQPCVSRLLIVTLSLNVARRDTCRTNRGNCFCSVGPSSRYSVWRRTATRKKLQPYPPYILHTFLDSRNVYPESVTVDQSSGAFFVGSVKEGTIYKGKIAQPGIEVFSLDLKS